MENQDDKFFGFVIKPDEEISDDAESIEAKLAIDNNAEEALEFVDTNVKAGKEYLQEIRNACPSFTVLDLKNYWTINTEELLTKEQFINRLNKVNHYQSPVLSNFLANRLNETL